MKKGFIFFLITVLTVTLIPILPSAGNTASDVTLTVVFKENQVPNGIETVISKAGGQILAEIPSLGAIQVKGSPDLISILQKQNSVQSVGPSLKLKLPKSNSIRFDGSASLPDTTNSYNNLLSAPASDEDALIQDEQPIRSNIKSRLSFDELEIYPDLYDAYQWDIKRVTNFGQSYNYERGNHEVVVGIIDTGVDISHPDLLSNLLGGKNFVPANYKGDVSETGNIEDINDRNGHGSYVAGAIAGKGYILGVAPEIGYKSYRVFGADGETDNWIVCDAIIGATDDAVDVISMSLGGYDIIGQVFWRDSETGKTYNLGNDVADYLLQKRAVKYAVDHGVTVVCSAGNEGMNVTNKSEVTRYLNNELGSQGYKFVGAGFQLPGGLPGAITVSATGPDDIAASYTNYGAGFVDITAPGGDFTRYPYSNWFEDMCFGAYKGGYVFMAGTSMAVPKVSAVAGLIISKFGKIDPDKVEQMIYQYSNDIGKTGVDNYFGHGMLQAPGAKLELPTYADWQRSFGGNGAEIGRVIHQTRDGGYIAVGTTWSFTKGEDSDYDMYVVKTNNDGKLEWRQVYGGPLPEYGNDIKETSDGGYIAAGYSKSFGDSTVIYLIKINKDGTTAWEKTITSEGYNLSAKSIFQDSDGGFIVAGEGTKNWNTDIYLAKLDKNGNKVWENTFGGIQSDTLQSFEKTNDGGYVALGQTYSNGLDNVIDFYVIKFDSNGQKEWEQMFGGSLSQKGQDIIQTEDGGYIILGSNLFNKYSTNMYMVKIDKNAEVQWEKFISEAMGDALNSINKTTDGNYIIAGTKNTPENGAEIYLAKMNSAGDVLWERNYGGYNWDLGDYAEQTKDKGYIILGRSYSYSASTYFTDMFFVKINESVEQ